jgi:hypothetical protein
MKNKLLIITLVAVIGFLMIVCDDGNKTELTNLTPVADDYTFDNLYQTAGNVTAVTITPKSGKSSGTISIKYNGSATIPQIAGTYTVTFDVAAVTSWNAAIGLSAGTLKIFDEGYNFFTSIADLETWLSAQPNNTADTAYTVALNVNYITGLATTLNNATNKYVNLDISGSTITSIGQYAFYNCTSLTSVTIGNSVTSIGNRAFSNCTNLTSIIIPNSVTSIEEFAFSGCKNLTSITIPDSVTSIGNRAFQNCDSLTSVTIPDSVTSIGGFAFYYCTNLTNITIPDSVTSIGEFAFGCTNLTSITIPDSVISIGDGAFSNCTSLTSVTIPDGVFWIGKYAFSNCTNLTSVTIGNSVTTTGREVFSGCTSLTSVTFRGTISSREFWWSSFPGDLYKKFYATDANNGTPGTYIRNVNEDVWTKQ